MSFLKLLGRHSFALLWSGQTISCLGDSLYTIALAWWILQKTGSAAAMSGVLICLTIPLVLFLLLGGAAGDRLPRVRLMLISDLLRAVVVGLLAFLALQQRLELWHIYVISAFFGMVQAFFYPTYIALVPDLVPARLLSSANSLRSVSVRGAQLIGPAIGAGIIVLGGTALAFALDGVSFVISAACLIALPQVSVQHHPATRDVGMFHDIRKGINTVLSSPWLWISLAISTLSTIFLDGPLETALPLLVKQRFGAQVGLYALFTTLSALGSICVAFWLGHFKRLRRRGLLTYGAWLVASLMISVVGLHLSVVAMSLAIFILGAAMTTVGLAWMSTLQEFVPAHLLGRVASIDLLASSSLIPIGYGLVGLAADRLGTSLVFILGGAISASLILLGLLHPSIRAVD